MRKSYTFYSLFGGRETWHPPGPDLLISANGIEWPSGKACLAPPDAHEVALCIAFLARCEQTKHPHIGSYWLKHQVESSAGEYIGNGALLEAARRLGVEFVVTWNNPNGILCLSKRSVRQAQRGAGGGIARVPAAGRARPAHGGRLLAHVSSDRRWRGGGATVNCLT